MNSEQARFNMIEQQVRPWNVLDPKVLELLAHVRREDFVPVAYKALAFADLEIPLACGQSMLVPRLEARLLQDLALQGHERVLEIGTGSGYMAALLAKCSADVTTIELHAELAGAARNALQRAGAPNVQVRNEDASVMSVKEDRYDAIVLSGSLPQVPDNLLQMLKPGGRLAAIIGEEPVMRATFITRIGKDEFVTRHPWDANAPRLMNFPEQSHFKF